MVLPKKAKPKPQWSRWLVAAWAKNIARRLMMKSYSEEMESPEVKKKVADAKLKALLKANPVSQTELSEVSESDAAKGLRNYGRMYKQGLGMKPDTNYEYSKGGKVGSASKRADGIAKRGKTRGKIV
jgi:hypothetical protein